MGHMSTPVLIDILSAHGLQRNGWKRGQIILHLQCPGPFFMLFSDRDWLCQSRCLITPLAIRDTLCPKVLQSYRRNAPEAPDLISLESPSFKQTLYGNLIEPQDGCNILGSQIDIFHFIFLPFLFYRI